MYSISFKAKVVNIAGVDIISIPTPISNNFPSRGPLYGIGKLDGIEFESIVEPDGHKSHYINISDLHLAKKIKNGIELNVEFNITKEWPEPQLDQDIITRLTSNKTAFSTWKVTTNMAKWEWKRWINSTKNKLTREKRIEVGLDKLQKGMKRPCCFNSSGCTNPTISKSGKLDL
ncbi:MAG: YdeI/OmpD-associated family protein [Patescibacteria group bacterium]